MEFLILVGTAREGRKTIRSARAVEDKFEQSGHEVEFFDFKNKDIPPLGNRTYVEDEEPVPEDIEELSRKVDETDCLVIVSPEYNHSIPGVLKKCPGLSFILSTMICLSHTSLIQQAALEERATSHLHDITIGLGGLPGPSLPISNVGEAFDENGEILEESYHERIERFVGDVEEHVEKFGQ